jgi:hypothetical protein
MSIIVQGSNNKTVQNITERDNIARLFDGLVVTVLDASMDSNVAQGLAIYRYTNSEWILESTNNLEKLSSDDVSLDTLQEVVDYIKTLNNEINILKNTPYNLEFGTY